MKSKRLPLVVLVAALAALGGSLAWAATRSEHSGRSVWQHGAAMMGGDYGGMMGDEYSRGSNPVSGIPDAKRRAQRVADRLGLRTGEAIQFKRNYYVQLADRQGRRATELLVDPESGAVSLEYGPAMMWNTRYGMIGGNGNGMMGHYGAGYGGMMGGMMMGGGGMMGGGYPSSTDRRTRPTVTPAEAVRIADRWLAANEPGLRAGEADAFPGYYTLETLRAGRVTGMLSVNAYTGRVWPHWWHGDFVAMAE